MTDLGYEPDRIRTWLSGQNDSPAFDRMADVVMSAMTEVGDRDLRLALQVLNKVTAMIVARAVCDASPNDADDIFMRVGPDVRREALRFVQAVRRDARGARHG